jgi:arsenite-transporting ATPase
MEIDPKENVENLNFGNLDGLNNDSDSKNFLEELIANVPGIDEAMAFGKLMSSIKDDKFDTIVFDTAPTGHTLKFLNFPNLL